MHRFVVVVALLALTTPLAWGQRGMRAGPVVRGPGFRSAPVMRPAPAPRLAPMPRAPVGRFAPPAVTVRRGFAPSGFAFGHIGRGGVRFRTIPFCNPQFISCQFQLANFFGRRHFFRPFSSPFFSPFGFGTFGAGYPIFWDEYPQADYSSAVAQPQPAPQPIVIYAQPPPQEQLAEAPAPEPQRTVAPPEPMQLPATVLVFRDQHREEVTNYAIAGDMVYVFNEHGRKKIALTDLDVPATVKVNDERGVEFRVPTRKGS